MLHSTCFLVVSELSRQVISSFSMPFEYVLSSIPQVEWVVINVNNEIIASSSLRDCILRPCCLSNSYYKDYCYIFPLTFIQITHLVAIAFVFLSFVIKVTKRWGWFD